MIKRNRKKLTAIEWFKNHSAVMPESETKEMFRMAISALKKQEADGWIPVSKDLPKKNGDYIVTCEVCGERYVEESFFCRCENGGMFWTSQNVIAWQPRIEPYTEEEA